MTIEDAAMKKMQDRAISLRQSQEAIDRAVLADITVRGWLPYLDPVICSEYALEELKAQADKLFIECARELERRDIAGERAFSGS